MANSVAPVCFVPVDTPTEQSVGVLQPSIPVATDANSTMQAVNAMRLMVMDLSGQMRGPAGRAGAAGKAGKSAKGGRFKELRPQRVTNKVKIASKQDPSTYIEFERIDALTFKDSKTGELWTWRRGGDGGSDVGFE